MRRAGFALLACALLAAQGAFWWHTHELYPVLEVVPAPPGKAAASAVALGDNEFYFRAEALEMQNFGDTFGRFTSLRFYDFSRLYAWMTLLDDMEPRSNLLPTLASSYFSQTQNTPDVRYMIDYLYHHSKDTPQRNWWWLVQAMYLANHKLDDMDLALDVGKPLLSPGVPAWAQEMVALQHEKRGEMSDALQILETIRAHADSLSAEDLNYIHFFITERMHKMDQMQKGYLPTDSGHLPYIDRAPEHP